MPIPVVIKMDRVPSKDNKRVMQHLLQDVDNYKSTFDMKVELIPRTKKNEPEAVIYIGSRQAVSGYSNIIPELKKAVGRISAVSQEDQVTQYFQGAIKKGEESEDMPHREGARSDQDLASALTRATAEREKRRPQKGVSKNKNGEPPREETRSISSGGSSKSRPSLPSSGSHAGDVMSTKRIMSGSASGDAQDNSDLAGMGGMDAVDSKWWANQFVTAGI